jgi:hypothetical protein
MMICKLKFSLSGQPWYNSDYYEFISDNKFINLKTGKTEEFFNQYMEDVTSLNETKRYLRDLKINNLLKNG